MTSISFEGVLEKSAAGIFRNKTKVWMVIRDTSLEYYKENKRSSCIGSIDLSEIQTIRQLLGQKGGCQFEIVSKAKTYIFGAETRELCETWVKVIQEAMVLRQQPTSSTSSETNIPSQRHTIGCNSIYDTVKDVLPTSSGANYRQSTESAIYAEPDDIQISPEVTSVFGVKLKTRAGSDKRSRTSVSSTSSNTSPSPTPTSPSTSHYSTNPEFSKTPEMSESTTAQQTTNKSGERTQVSSDVHSKRISFQRGQHQSIVTEDDYCTIDEVASSASSSQPPSGPASETSPHPELDTAGNKGVQNDDEGEVFYDDALSVSKPEEEKEIDDDAKRRSAGDKEEAIYQNTTAASKLENVPAKDEDIDKHTSSKSGSKPNEQVKVVTRRESAHLYDDPENVDENTVVMRRSSRRSTPNVRDTNGTDKSFNGPVNPYRSKLLHQDSSFDDHEINKDIEQIYDTIFNGDDDDRELVVSKSITSKPAKSEVDVFEAEKPAYVKLKEFLETDLGIKCNGMRTGKENPMAELRKFLDALK